LVKIKAGVLPGVLSMFGVRYYFKLPVVSELSSFVLLPITAFLTSFWFVIKTLLLIEFLLPYREYEILSTVLTYDCSVFHFFPPDFLKEIKFLRNI